MHGARLLFPEEIDFENLSSVSCRACIIYLLQACMQALDALGVHDGLGFQDVSMVWFQMPFHLRKMGSKQKQ